MDAKTTSEKLHDWDFHLRQADGLDMFYFHLSPPQDSSADFLQPNYRGVTVAMNWPVVIRLQAPRFETFQMLLSTPRSVLQECRKTGVCPSKQHQYALAP